MKTIQCLVILGVTLCMGSIRVSANWNGENPSHRFRISKPVQEPRQDTGGLIENGPENQFIESTILHNPFQTNPSKNQFAQPRAKPTMVLDQNGLHINTPLENRRYQDIKIPTYQTNFNYKKPQKLLQNYNDVYDKYPTLPVDISRIKPLATGTISYGPIKEAPANQVLLQYNPTISSVPVQNNKFVVPASQGLSTPSSPGFQVNENVETIQFTTKKEPVFLVTEGYRNVLVQGPTKKTQYNIQNQPERREESRRFINKENVNDEKEDENKSPTTRKLAKIDKIHENESKGFNIESSNKNLVQPAVEKPRQYFESDEGRSRFNNEYLTKNYRDDRLHEPSEDFDNEREDDDKERINDDKEIEEDDDDEEETENTKTKEKIADDKQSSSLPETDKEEDDEENNDNDDDDELEDEDESEPEKDEKKPVPHSEHADPKPIPTKPIYPGEGLWAKPGIKHRPHISPHKFLKPIEDEQRPDGYDVFEELEHFFQNQRGKFDGNFGKKNYNAPTANSNAPAFSYAQPIKTPDTPNSAVVFDPFRQSGTSKYPANGPSTLKNYHRTPGINVSQRKQSRQGNNEDEESEDDQNEDSDEKASEEFVPVRLYSQVRNTEDVSHEPRDPAEHGRLKELIKDKKVQTVYSEEGYEDSAYDHAGHEKKAEEDQGYAQFEKEKQEPAKSESQKKKDSEGGHTRNIAVSDKPLTDSVASESIYKSRPKSSHVEDAGSSNNFMASQELKTTQVKDKDNGDVQLEIQSEVKMIIQPNNSTEAHKYVKIYPKVLKEVSNKPSNLEENDSSTTESSTVSEIESEKPKVTVKVLDENGALKKLNLTRKKRAADDGFEDVNIDKEFLGVIDKINHTFTPPKPESVDAKKYPYYNRPGLNLDSPLRYAENMQNIPTKRAGELSFYKMADKLECPDLPQDVNPLPEKVKKSRRRRREIESDDDEDEESDEDDEEDDEESVVDKKQPKGPRIQLGDKIDCLKVRYFGENPLDSPFFKEETVGPVLPIFKDLSRNSNIKENIKSPDNLFKSSKLNENINKINEAFNKKDNKFDTQATNKIFNTAKTNVDNNLLSAESIRASTRIQRPSQPEKNFLGKFKPTPGPVSLITTPKYTIQLVPNNIYDQIKLLDHLPEDGVEEPVEVTTKRVVTTTAKAKKFKKEERKGSSIKVDKNLYRNDNKIATTQENNRRLPNIAAKAKKEKKEGPRESIIEVRKKIYRINKSIETTQDNDKREPKMLFSEKVQFKEEKKGANEAKKTVSEPKITASKPKNTVSEPKITASKPKNTVSEPKITASEPKNTVSAPKNTVSKPKNTVLKPKSIVSEQKNIASEPKNTFSEPEALRRRIRPRRPMFEIFDVSKFLTTTPFPYIYSAASTVLPKHKVLSEVFYKDDIKPNEQLNVFADVLNNIKDSSRIEIVPIPAASDFGEPGAVTVSSLDEPTMVPKIQYPTSVRVKKFQTDSSHEQNTFDDAESYDVQKHYHVNKPSTSKPDYSTHKISYKQYNNIRDRPTEAVLTSQSTSNPVTQQSNRKIAKRRRKPSTSTTLRTTTNIYVPNNQDTPSNHQPYVIDFIEDTEEVLGLVPPQNFQYRTIMVDGTNDVPEQTYKYSTLQANTPTEPIVKKQPAPVTEPSDEAPAKRPMNKYYFVGLKPPVQQRVRPYSEFNNNHIQVNNNLLRKRVSHVGLTRVRRNAARHSYADVTRNRGGQSEGLSSSTSSPSDDVDDYVPHRPKNYHYDEKTGKIIYHNKPAEEKIEEEEMEYEEIPETPGIYLEKAEDATHPTPEKVTTKELLATATPPPEGKGLLDFVVKLKNNPSYKYIPDPSTPKPGSVTSTTEAFSTVDPKSTNPPEFLSILSKVKTDKTYKHIEDPKESQSKVKATITTPKVENEEEYEDEEEEDESEPGKNHTRQTRQITNLKIFNIGDFLPKIRTPISSNNPTNFFKKQVVERLFPRLRYMTPYDIAKEYYKQTELYKFIKKQVQNSPGGQNLGNFQIFDIGDYLPKIKTFTPKTTVDYSKYKTIERPHTRHNISSKYSNEEEKESVVNEEVVSRPPPEKVSLKGEPIVVKDTESVVNNKAADTATSTTTQRIVQLRRGTRPTTQRTTAETEEPTESTKRSASRRRPSPSGFKTNRRTTAAAEVTEATEQIQKIYPASDSTNSDSHDKAKRVYRKRPVRIRHTTERHEEDDDTIERIVRRSLDSKEYDVEDEDLGRKHIQDTYQDIKDEIINDDTDKVQFGESQKREIVEKMPKDVDVIKKDYDKTKKNGGNYRRENEQQKSEQQKLLKDKTSEDRSLDDNDNKKESTINQNKKDDVEITDKDYDKKKKHGGNYHKEDEDKDTETEEDETEKTQLEAASEKRSLEDDNDKEATVNQNKKNNVEVTNKNYDRKKKHGGNYRKEFEDEDTKLEEDESEQTDATSDKIIIGDNDKEPSINQNKKNNVEITNKNYDKKKKHGGNYRKEFEDEDIKIEEDESEQTEATLEKIILEDDNDKEATIINQNANKNVEITNKDYDKKKKHGGNYRKEFDDTKNDSEKVATVVQIENNNRLAKLVNVSQNKKDNAEIINKNYDKKKKHGGNYRKEIEDEDTETGQDEPEITATVVQVQSNKKLEKLTTGDKNPKDKVEITNKDYDKKKKHGGNYRREFEDAIETATVAKHASNQDKKDNEEITNKNYDRWEFEDKDTEVDEEYSGKVATALKDENKKKLEKSINGNKKKEVDIINKQYDKTKKHGGNYKSDEEAIIDGLLENSKSNIATPKSAKSEETGKARTSTEQPKRLSDVVPKPDHFYSDPQLPKQINKLGSERPPVKLAPEEIDQIAMEGDLDIKIEKPQQPIPSLRRRTFDDDVENEETGEFAVSKKPLFIKDPSKRLYFYAPI